MLQFAGFLFDLKIKPGHRPKTPASCRKGEQKKEAGKESGRIRKKERKVGEEKRGRAGKRSGSSAAPRRTKCVKREGRGIHLAALVKAKADNALFAARKTLCPSRFAPSPNGEGARRRLLMPYSARCSSMPLSCRFSDRPSARIALLEGRPPKT